MRRLLVAVWLLSLPVAFSACDLFTEDCGPFKDKFRTIDFRSEARKIAFGDSLRSGPDLSPIAKDTLAYSAFAIRMDPVKELYSLNSRSDPSFGFVSSAYACSPPIPSSDEIIRDIQVYSDKDFNSEYTAGDDLADLFDVVVLNEADHVIYRRFDVQEFLSSEPNAADELILVLNSAPRTTSDFRFTVKYFQEGDGLNYYEFTTETVTLRPG